MVGKSLEMHYEQTFFYTGILEAICYFIIRSDYDVFSKKAFRKNKIAANFSQCPPCSM